MKELQFIKLLGTTVFKGAKPILKIIGDGFKANYKASIRRIDAIADTVDDLAELAKEAVSGDLIGAFNEVIDIVTSPKVSNSIKADIRDSVKLLKKNTATIKDAIKASNWRSPVDWHKYAQQSKEASTNKQNNKRISEGSIRMKKKQINKSSTRLTKEGVGKNHPEWYLKDPTLINSLVGINISNRQNAVNEYMLRFRYSTADGKYQDRQFSVPSCAGLLFELTIPKTKTGDWQQGINMLYKNVRSANAGAINGSPGQYANYVFSIRSIDALLSTLGRAIKLLNSGTFYDARSPQAMFAAMGLDYDSFATNAANARELYSRLSAIRYRLMPLNITLLDRTRWLFSNVFADSDDAKAQTYVPYIDKVYMIGSDNDVRVVDCAEGMSSTTTGKTYDVFSAAILKAFELYQNDSVFQVIAGDILKAYGNEALTKYPEIANAEVLKPVYDVHILTQIQNATLSVTGNVTQGFIAGNDFVTSVVSENISLVNGVSYDTPINPTGVTSFNKVFRDPMYNSNVNVVEPGRVLSSTRLMVSRHGENAETTATAGKVVYDTYGTEILEKINIILASANVNQKYGLAEVAVSYFCPFSVHNANGIETMVVDIPAWSWFDYFPYVIPFVLSTIGTTVDDYVWAYNVPIFDFNNFGIVYQENLESYNAIATLSMLHKAFIARVNKTEVIEH